MNLIKFTFLVIFQIIVSVVVANNHAKIDSLLNELSKSSDTTKIKNLLLLAESFYFLGDVPNAEEYCLQAIDLAKEVKSDYFLAKSYLVMGGKICNGTGDLSKATFYLLEAQKVADKIANSTLKCKISNSLGNTYFGEKNFYKAMEFYKTSFSIAEELNDLHSACIALIGIGRVHMDRRENTSALEAFQKAADGFSKLKDDNNYIVALVNIGTLYFINYENDKAREYQEMVLQLAEKNNNVYVAGIVLSSLAEIDLRVGKLDDGIEKIHKAIILFKNVDDKYNQAECYKIMSKIFHGKNRNDSAYYYAEIFSVMQDSIFSERNTSLIAEMQTKYETAKKEEENKLLLSQKELAEEKIQQQLYFVVGLSLFLITVLIFSYSLFKSNRDKQRNNLIISKQKEDVEIQRALLQQKNKEILDSINYAKRLQDAILPPVAELKKYLPDSFVIYKPKDIVAGDFYWSNLFYNENDGTTSVLLAAADCTGHGVPGAIMSVVCSEVLNKVVNEMRVTTPGEILDQSRILVAQAFIKKGAQTNVYDGMDISLVKIELFSDPKDEINIEWAGANNPIWIIKNNQLVEIKGTKQAIGNVDSPQPFETHFIRLKKGESFFIFSDGYADQFGGPRGKKFTYKRMKEMFLTNVSFPPDKQKDILEYTIESWKDGLEQVDDILLIGVTI